MAKDIEVKVKYIPDTSALKNVMKGAQNVEFKVGGSNLKKDLLSPVQNAMKEVNKAMSSGANNADLLKLFQNVNMEADKVRQKLNSMSMEMNAAFNSAGNQQMLKQLAEYRKELEKVEKESKKWASQYGNATITKLRDNAGVKNADQARKQKSALEADLAAGKELTAQEQTRLAALKEYIKTLEERNRLQKQGVTAGSFEEQKKNISNKINDITGNVQTEKYNAAFAKDIASAHSFIGNTTNYATQEINKLNAAIKTEENVVKEGKKELTKFGDILTGTFLGTSLGNLFQTGLQRGIQFFKDYDETLTRTMMVTGMTRDEVNGLTESYNKLANQLSSTTKDVAAAQLVFYQQGLGTREALAMTEASIAISKTGGIEAAEAANRLTAAVRGYQLAANDAMDIADKMSALDAAAASSVDELTVAMQKSASQARMAGLDLDYYMAYLSTMQEVTREAPENIGTAMKSITSRMQEIRDIGKIEEDGTTFSNVAKALSSIGIAATDSSGQLRSLQAIMDELGPMWATLDRNHKAYIATTLAGNRQQSRFIALMDNYDRAMELVNVSQNANGESAKQLRAYNQGLEASFTALSNAWQQFATKVADSDIIKSVVDLLTDFIEILNKIPSPITQAVVPLMGLIKGFQLFSNARKVLNQGKSKLFESLGIDAKDSVEDLNKTLERAPELVKKFYGAFKEGNKVVKENVDVMEKSNETLKEGQEAIEGNAASHDYLNAEIAEQNASMSGNDQIKQTEVGENRTLVASQQNLENAVEQVNADLEQQNRLFNGNADPKKKKQSAVLDETTEQLSMLRTRKELIGKSQDQLKLDMKGELETVRADYEAHADTLVRQFRAIEKAGIKNFQPVIAGNKKDLFEAYEARAFTAKGNPKRTQEAKDAQKVLEILKKDYAEIGAKYHQAQLDIKDKYKNPETGLFSVGNKEVAEIDKEIKKVQKKRKKIQKELNKPLETPIPEKSKNLFGTFKDIANDKQLDGVQKLGKGFGELSKSVGGFAGILSNIAIGSMVAMGAETIGLDEDLSGALGTFTTLGKTLSGFGPWGWAAAAAIAGLQFTFDKLWPSAEKTQAKLAEIQQEQDAINQKISDIETNLEVYEELSGKIGKTEEESQRLKDATDTLVEQIPGAVAGYNSYGEAVLNTAKAYEELKKQQAEASAKSTEALEQFDKLQDGANRGEKIAASILGIGSAIATVAGIVTLNPFLVAGGIAGLGGTGIWGAELSDKQIEENRKVWDENYSEILANYQAKRDEFLLDVNEQNQDTASKVIDSFINSMMEAGRDGKINDATKAIEELMTEFADISWAKVENAMSKLSARQGVLEMTVGQARTFLEKELKESLKNSGLTDIEIQGVITAILNIEYEGAGDLEALKKSINTEIDNLESSGGDQDQINALKKMRDELDLLNQEELALLKNAGMLDATYAQVFSNNGGMKKTLSSFRQQNGELNKQRAIIASTNDLLKQQEADQKKIDQYKANKTKELENFEKGFKDEYFNVYNIGGKNHGKTTFDENTYNKVMEEYKKRYDQGYRSGDNAIQGGEMNGRGDPDQQGLYLDDGVWEDGFDKYVQYRLALEENDEKINQLTASTNKYEDEIADLMSKIESYAVPTFQELSDKIGEMKQSWDSFLDLGDKLDSTGGILDADGLMQLFDLLGSYEDAAFQTQQQFDAWMHAIDGVNQGLSMENGQLHLNAGAMTSINDLISYSTRLKANDMLMSIEQGKAELENQKLVLEAQKAAVDAEITKLKTMSDAEYEAAVESGTLQEEFKQAYIDLLDQTNLAEIDAEENKLNSMLTLNNNYYKQLASMRTAYANGEDVGDVQWLDIKGEYEKVYDRFVNETANSFTSLISKDREGTIKALESYSASLGQQIGNLDKRINSEVELKETIAEYLASDSTNLGKAFDDAAQSASDYAEQLERTLTLLEKIEGLQHTIDENETFKDLYEGYDGESYGRIIMSNLKLAQEQYDVYKDLFDMQQEMTNQAAGDLLDSPYGDMFTIAENGDIGWADDSMYEKYKGLPDDMQEDIDGLVEAYQEQRDELRSTEKDLSKYAQAVKAAREELVAMEIEIENELVNALKNREKIMHDARMKAIDDEVKMIEEAVERRRKAREEDDSEKELFQAQEALRRATLDSSGKNNASLLQLQQDLEDKQLEISEKRFEDDMEDRKQWLQDTKDAETETYEYRLETMTWYWENVQAIQEAGQEAMMQTLIHWNEEYRTQSQLQQSEMLREWQFTMDAMKTAADMGAELGQLTIDITEVTSEVESMNISIDKLPGTWQRATDAANRYSNAAREASSYKPTGYNPDYAGDTDKPDDNLQNSTTTENNDKIKMKKGDKIEFRPTSNRTAKVAVYDDSGVSVGTYQNGMGDKNGTAGDIKNINGERMVYFKPAGGYVPTRHFQKQGDWGNSKRYYAHGGIVDYTGPAWVDGTKTKPEAFLNPYQTEQIAALAGALNSKNIGSAMMNSNVTFGSVNFNVASMSSAADGKKALEVFVQGANDLMAKKGIGTKLNINVK